MVMVILMAPTQLFLCHIKPMKRSLNNEHILTDLPFTCSKEAVASQSACKSAFYMQQRGSGQPVSMHLQSLSGCCVQAGQKQA